MLPIDQRWGWRTLRRPGSPPLVVPVAVPPESTEFFPGRVSVTGLDNLPRDPYGKAVRSMRKDVQQVIDWLGMRAVVDDAALCHMGETRSGDLTARAFIDIREGDLVRRWNLRAGPPSVPARGNQRDIIPLSKCRKVIIKGCPCMLSGPAFRLDTAEGPFMEALTRATTQDLKAMVNSFTWAMGPTLYEIESIDRLTEDWATVAHAIKSTCPQVEVEDWIDRPNTGYDLYFADASRDGYLPNGMYLDLIDLFDARTALLVGMVRESLLKKLRARGVRVKVRTMEPLEVVAEALRSELESGRRAPSWEVLFGELFRNGGDLWPLLGSTGFPQDTHEAASLGYVHTALFGAMSLSSEPDTVLIHMENASEGPIQAQATRRARAILKHHPLFKFNHFGIYSYERFSAGREGEDLKYSLLNTLYQYDPGLVGVLPNGDPVYIPELLPDITRLSHVMSN